jgi:DNA-binding beta-propeller fold protein YncE
MLTLALCHGGCAPTNPAATVEHIFGETGMGPGEFSYPRAMLITPDQALYIVDKAARIQRYRSDGTFAMDWRMPEWSAGKPTGLGLGPKGRIFVADTHYSRVMVFEADGTLVGQFGGHGRAGGQFILPTDVAVTPAGAVYVSEYGGNDRISRFTADWVYEFSFGDADAGEAALARPQALYLDDDGTLWVADACNHRICHFSADGLLLGTFGRNGTELGALRFPYALDRLSDGTFVVCEYGNNRVQRFTAEGRSLGTWGSGGRAVGELAYPWAVAVGARDRMYVLDSGNNRVQIVDAGRGGTWRRP